MTIDSLSRIASKLKYIIQDEDTAGKAKIENCVGSIKVPVGIASPLSVKGYDGTDGAFYAPLATCESTLAASCLRGFKLFTDSGDIQFKGACLLVFYSRNAASFYDLLPDLFPEFQEAAQSTSKYAKLMKVDSQLVGSTVHVIFEYYCGNAAGQNMVTFDTQEACDRFAASNNALVLKLRIIMIEGQSAAEKSLSWRNILQSRGVSVMAWGTITQEACEKILGIPTWDLYELIQNSREVATRNGQLGYSINQENVVAAMFIACGQDAGSIAESAWSHLTTKFNDETKELGVSTYFPSLHVGTVGGGSKGRLAGLIASFSLALDMSTVAAVTNNTFAASHYRFARAPRNAQSKL
ncbi:hydroxymethylglutaryl-coenzyme A reductase family protein [Penicillium malachiteum]|uniref:hydroxymethylglutaryl-coenzyme A reductase family protein n=1 Tax=Penicillium malachiteum TaxID=1324776 RepID=UPI00254945FC|nr:hydroxymethylglutaryl-coenzyme A reductase family protein [Penicillium malachiteum]KAJ5726019.1 hydroxymethylglutaryl-coenzyme A reductase family protein [Penicillium malachiteum]